MVRRTDRPLRVVRVSFETTRFSAQHLIEAYTALVPVVRRPHLRALREKAGSPAIKAMTAKRRRGEA
ncbi:MAG TPA: hypothetical protein VF760_05450 [Xanthobacteraceae bacterium]